MGQMLDDGFPGRVLVLELEGEAVERTFAIGSLDGIGPAVYVEETDLALTKVVDVVEWNEETGSPRG